MYRSNSFLFIIVKKTDYFAFNIIISLKPLIIIIFDNIKNLFINFNINDQNRLNIKIINSVIDRMLIALFFFFFLVENANSSLTNMTICPNFFLNRVCFLLL